MRKRNYTDCLNEINSKELFEGLLGYGFFSEKLPPIFSAVKFYEQSNEVNKILNNVSHNNICDYIRFPVVRNTGGIRMIAIPNPIEYFRLCEFLKLNWDKIVGIFTAILSSKNIDVIKSKDFSYVAKDANYVSQIHLRKIKDSKSIFEMRSYEDRFDLSTDEKLMLGKRYYVKADISSCFPSIYTHTIQWAIVGKEKAKKCRDREEWVNKFDKLCRNINFGESKGLLIGPVTSNLVSELILAKIDEELAMKYSYVRYIDDYHCFVQSYKEGEQFLQDLAAILDKYRLTLNYNKIKILKLPMEIESDWPLYFKSNPIILNEDKISYSQIKYLYHEAIRLMQENEGYIAILNYFIKVMSKKKFSFRARRYFVLYSMHLALLYPYLVRILDKFVFKAQGFTKESIQSFSEELFIRSREIHNIEGICYAIYFSLIYHHHICSLDNITSNEIVSVMKQLNNCILNLLLWLYFKQNHEIEKNVRVYEYAKDILENDMDKNWLFIYEVLNDTDLRGFKATVKKNSKEKNKDKKVSPDNYWARMKQLKISFLSPEFVDQIAL